MPPTDEPGGDGAARTVAEWRAACETGDGPRAVRLLSPDVVLHSPLVDGVRFAGRAQAGTVLEVALPLFTDVRFTTVVRDGSIWVLVESARIGGRDVEEAQVLRLDDRAAIVEVTLMVRPFPGLAAVMAGIAGPMSVRAGRSVPTATVASLLARMVQGVVAVGDRIAVWLVARWSARTAPRPAPGGTPTRDRA